MSLKEELLTAQHRAAADRAGREAVSLRSRVSLLTKERDKLLGQLQMIERLDAARAGKPSRPEWAVPAKKKGVDHRATLCLLITDTHFDEVVDPAEVDGINAYNREIAELRLRRCVERTIHLARHYISGVTYDGLAVFLGGDIFSGNIHEELARTNEDTLFRSLDYWIDPMVAALGALADEFRRLHVACSPGNHGRQSRKPIAKQRAADNLDWLFYRMLAREMRRDGRIAWEIPAAADTHVQIYSTRYLLTHGDQFRGGSGIAGALSPLLLGSHRKTRRQAAVGRPYDYMVLGHWHQEMLLPSKSLLVGPCMKGFDEFAYVSNYEPEPPKQALWLTTPEHGITVTAPVLVSDRAAEGW